MIQACLKFFFLQHFSFGKSRRNEKEIQFHDLNTTKYLERRRWRISFDKYRRITIFWSISPPVITHPSSSFEPFNPRHQRLNGLFRIPLVYIPSKTEKKKEEKNKKIRKLSLKGYKSTFDLRRVEIARCPVERFTMSAAEKSSIPGSWPGGSSDLPLITVHSQFIVHLSAIASSLWGLFPLLLRAVGDPPSSRDPLQRGKFRRRKRSLRLSQEKGEPLLKADSGPEDVPCTDALMEQRGLINGQANNEGTMNGRTNWGGKGGGKGDRVWRLRNCDLLRRTTVHGNSFPFSCYIGCRSFFFEVNFSRENGGFLFLEEKVSMEKLKIYRLIL